MFAYVLLGLVLAAGAAGADPTPAAPAAPLDLNRATAEELETLPGIGAAKAAAIVAARDAQGGFTSLEELEHVRGIGPALMAKLRPLVFVGGSPNQPGPPAKAGANLRSAPLPGPSPGATPGPRP
ncbi:MAG: helix-hairpin-helix domain-containing protein [Myxococcota bacterium]